MKIIADENIPRVTEAFSTLGDVSLVNGRSMGAADVRDADILLVRSVTRVDANLLAGSDVRFVGSATIGFDHVDRDYLAGRGIGFATAPGSNATSAAEYVISALLVLSGRHGIDLQGRTLGIVGRGNVGSRVRQKAAALGLECLVNDPPLQAAGVADEFVDLETVLQCDFITLHVPYTREGQWPTHHLLDGERLQQLRPGATLINTARGAAVDNTALNDFLASGPDVHVVLDVWENEPAINIDLLHRVEIATPHIAGYSLDGKLRGTAMIYRAACDALGVAPGWDVASVLPSAPVATVSNMGEAILASYDIREDDARLRTTAGQAVTDRAAAFDRLRKEYPVRREFAELQLDCRDCTAAVRDACTGLGFRLPEMAALA